jgi:4-hydroxybenzoate polyprenyltransferase
VFPRASAGFGAYIKALRVHQWVKNLLIFVPLAVSHQATNPQLLISAAIAFFCFSLCASSVYIVNDLLDLQSDRLHPRKRFRPFAAGQLSISSGVGLAFACLAAGIALSLTLPMFFRLTLIAYLVATTAYTLSLKARAVVDVLTLGGLYTVRIIAGSAATLIFPSFWLLALSMFLFLSLAVVKRYAELLVMAEDGKKDLHGRGYVASDLPLLISIGVANGAIAVLVLALYVNSPEVGLLYGRPQILWLMPPLMLYWISRIWLKTHRGEMHDDPIVFAAGDRPSLIAGALLVGLLAIAAFY